MLGKRVIGEAAVKEARAKAVASGGGGAIQLGRRLSAVQPAPVKGAVVPKEERPGTVGPPRTSGNRAAPSKRATPPKRAPSAQDEQPLPGAPAAAPPAFSEDEVAALLKADPNQWERVVDAESLRPEGPRSAVAGLLLGLDQAALAKPMPSAILETLEKIATPKVGA